MWLEKSWIVDLGLIKKIRLLLRLFFYLCNYLRKKTTYLSIKNKVYKMRKTYIDYSIPILACSIHSDLNYDKNSFQRYLQSKSNSLALYIVRWNDWKISESRLFLKVKFQRKISYKFGRWCNLLLVNRDSTSSETFFKQVFKRKFQSQKLYMYFYTEILNHLISNPFQTTHSS